ncbi:subtilisin-like protein [Mytilinidion resinicola]|uniref:Subtilisin-like protein n=1 Tax=Mytilinidion resinicola TaxID=574789 RepID=A0A6A6YNU4_9PEZI|nr:subtilisin-like protein [Mytilinidion resinicola]KAF2809684.1 subtilisin-like protein [Mytilinidion resinicola]
MDFTADPPLTKNGTDTCGHGTHVAGIVLQLAPNAELHVGRVSLDRTFDKRTDPECTARIAEAIRYAVDVWGVDVISMSLGFSSIPTDVKEAIIYAYSKDRILVAAASNNGNSKIGNVTYPASHLGLVICVNAANYAGTPHEFNPPATSSKDNFSILGEEVKSTWSKDAKGDAKQDELDLIVEEGAP